MYRKQFIRAITLLPFAGVNMQLREFSSITDSLPNTESMPVLFLGHGSPMNAIEENEFVRGWRRTGELLPKPKAILCVSAHWETRGTYVTAMDRPKTIHDFGGFPKALYEVEYAAPGSPDLAKETQSIVTKTEVGLDHGQWGLDHGCWSVVKHLYPKADIPIIQMSLDHFQNADYHYELAKELQILRQKGILIVGSGNMVHNLRMVAWDKLNDDAYGYDWAIEANETMKQKILSGDHNALIHYENMGRAFDLAIPTPDHFLPLLYILALQKPNEKISFFNDKPVGGSLTMTSVLIHNDL